MGRVRIALALGWVAIAACVDPRSTVCGDGSICPPGLECAGGGCYPPAQIEACEGLGEGDACQFGDVVDALCRNGVCVQPGCGDGQVDDGEECDDGQDPPTAGDGCSATCMTERCGNARFDPTEECDCGDDAVTDRPAGCAGPNADAEGPCTSACLLACNDGVQNATEACDTSAPKEFTCLDFGFDAGHLGCSGFCTLDFTSCLRLGWWPEAAADAGLAAVWTDGNQAFVVGDTGWRSRLDAQGWYPEPGGDNWTAIWGSSSSDVFAVGDTGAVTRFDGTAWSSGDVGTTENLRGVWGSAGNDVWAVGDVGGIYHFDGTAWTQLFVEPGVVFAGIWGAGATDLWAVGADDTGAGAIYHYDGGDWTPASVPVVGPLLAVSGSASGAVWAVGSEGAVLRWDGGTWTRQTVPTGAMLFGVWTGGAETFAVGELGTVLHHDASGWTPLAIETAETLRGVHAVSATEVWAVGSSGRLLRWGGLGWAPPVATGGELTDVFAVAPDDVLAVGAFSTALRNQGDGWIPMAAPNIDSLTEVWGAAGDAIWVGGQWVPALATIARWDGTQWSEEPIAFGERATGMSGTGASNVWVGTDAGSAYHWNGTDWEFEMLELFAFADLWAAPSGELFAIGDGGQRVIRSSTGQWSVDPGNGASCHAVWGTSATDVYSACDFGLTEHWDGVGWAVVATGGANLRALSGTATDDVFAVGDVGTIRWFDGEAVEPGRAWQPVRSGTFTDLTGVAATPRTVWFTGQDGTILRLVRSQP